ncbi:MSMEG_0568 family radical SAM protein [Marinoscillum sp. MHG1-6]|uniref:MSMEG_0568 family radical SAM protein n=1 Tax=Marinoscillum sp. MHG1-6 TaxID=2959627 RepID=UPI00215706BA|nr:MSMEG_0568 family radical SAM protein [Marinoscillum sp. MHG1-6]
MIQSKTLSSERVQVELQTYGMRMQDIYGSASRKGGAGPTDHKAVFIDGNTIMVPVHNSVSSASPYWVDSPNELGVANLYKGDEKITTISFPKQPNFYKHITSDGIPMWKIAQLHSHNVLATTVLQNCVRYYDKATSCQFCAIGESLKADRTIAYKKPHHLAEVARIAIEKDKIDQMIITTGTPSTPDRGAKILFESVMAIKEVANINIQVQCEPPNDFAWFQKLKDAGADAIGMHLEAVEEHVRQMIMPGKAEVNVAYYLEAFKAAVKVFGKGNVSTYILAGLGDSREAILEMSRKLINMGVYPFVVPFVPIGGTPLANASPPDQSFMESLLTPVGRMLVEAEMTSDTLKAGCAKCGACSTLKAVEQKFKKTDKAYAA